MPLPFMTWLYVLWSLSRININPMKDRLVPAFCWAFNNVESNRMITINTVCVIHATSSGCSAVGSALGLGPRCRGFESLHLDH